MRKYFSVAALTLAAALTGCHYAMPDTSPSTVQAGEPLSNSATRKMPADTDTVTLQTIVVEVKKSPAVSWKTLLPEWHAGKDIAVLQGDGKAIYQRLAAGGQAVIKYSNSSVTPNMTALPLLYRDCSDTTGSARSCSSMGLVLRPGFKHTEGPLSLMLDLHMQDPQHSVSIRQFVSMQPGQTVLAGRALEENTLQVVLITPYIHSPLHGAKP
ncbi:hypothetical protein [Citrobacter koseri]|uniref:hypothetical protein n=1 Tax=Citrobacter koseri TaxID=545 RepID=UPI000DF1009B|nr:hypothetical protein [Citrobacter koseri]EJF0242666.1 hypothetical protein [Salmonella enterica subsp. enterica serovar Liverpool]STB73768.1 Uncharacterised protein [Citrobacter koseri]